MKWIAAIVALALSATAQADETRDAEMKRLGAMILEHRLAGQARVMRIADRIRIENAHLCEKQGPVLGVYSIDEKSVAASDWVYRHDATRPYLQAMRLALRDRFGWDGGKQIMLVVPELPGDRAGLRPGDVVTHVNGKKLRKKERLQALKARGGALTLGLTVEREGQVRKIQADSWSGCSYPSYFHHESTINAFALLSQSTNMFAGMLDLFESDDDLAVIQGHELAHIILDSGGTKKTEAQADYLGLYLAARAGFDISQGNEVWNTLGRENPYSTIDWGFYAHPTSAERRLAIEATITEISAKQERGESLDPGEQPTVEVPSKEEATSQLRAEALARLGKRREQLLRVSHKLRTGARTLCGEAVAPVLGAAVGRRRDVLRGKQSEAEEIFGLVDEVKVLAILPSSPAAEAGLEVGDLIVRVSGKPIQKTSQVFDALRDSESGSVPVAFSRNGEEMQAELPRVEGCHHAAMLFMDGQLETVAHPNRKDVLVPSAAVEFARNDDELAIVVAHQIAHHLEGTVLAIDAHDEPAADRRALLLAAYAGFDVSKASELFDRFVLDTPWKLGDEGWRKYSTAGRLHAGWLERSLAIQETLVELEAGSGS